MRHTFRTVAGMVVALAMLIPCFVVSMGAFALDSTTPHEESAPLVWQQSTNGGWESLLDHVVVLLNNQGNKAVGCSAHDGVLDAVDYEADGQNSAPQWYFEQSSDSLIMYCQDPDGNSLFLASDSQGMLSLTSNKENAAPLAVEKQGSSWAIRFKSADWRNLRYEGSREAFDTTWDGSNAVLFTVWAAALPKEPGKPDSGDDSSYTRKTNTVSPSSSIINLFDYWEVAGDRFAATPGWEHGGPTNSDEAINKDHAFKFARLTNLDPNWGLFNQYTGSEAVRTGIVANTLDYGYPKLSGDTNGFPPKTNPDHASESLRYLFDPTFEVADGRAVFPNAKGLLSYTADGYLEYNSKENFARFDEDKHNFNVYTQPATCNTQQGGQFFPFNAASTIAKHTENNGCQAGDINHFFGLSLTARFVQRYQGHTDATSKIPTTFEFSGDDDVWVFIDDVLVADLGGMHNAASVKIDFTTGNITINGTETSTLKQQYAKANRENDYDWLEGTDTFADDTSHTLKFFYLERGSGESNMHLKYNLLDVPETALTKVDQYGDPLEGAVFATYRGHEEADGTVKYLRDGTDNDYIEWPTNAVVDTDTGIVYTDNAKTQTLFTPTFRGVTDAHGEILFANGQGAYTVEEIKQNIGTEFVLRELQVPEGYRTVSDESVLYFAGDLLRTRNPFRNGVWTQPSALVTATNQLFLVDDNTQDVGEGNHRKVDYYTLDESGKYTSNGTLFAVPLKRSGVPWTGVHNTDDWTPLYGNAEYGYSVSAKKGVAGAIEAAQRQNGIEGGRNYGGTLFSARANGMQASLREQPGETTSYYTYVEQEYFGGDTAKIIPILAECGTIAGGFKNCQAAIGKGLATQEQLEALDSVEYFIAFYWTSASSLNEANAKNTWRVHSHRNSIQDKGINTDEYMGFNVKWGSSIHVPNVENRLIFQNHIYEDVPQNTDGQDPNHAYIGSTFALYSVGEAKDNHLLYYLADNNGTPIPIYLEPDPKRDGQLTNRAWVVDPETGERDGRNIGRYEISQSGADAGTITVTIGTETYTIKPAKNASGEPCIKNTLAQDDQGNLIKENGANQFERLRKGKYVLRQITAPTNPKKETYAINIAEAKVEVTDRAIYANAGGDRNGVLVGNGVGYVVKTLAAFASRGVVDETLSWIASCLRVNKAQTFAQFEQFLNGQEAPYGKDSEENAREGISSDTTTNLMESMATYLEYVPQANKTVFDYKVTEDQSAASRSQIGENKVLVVDGEDLPHLYTDEGWSKLVIYQDIGYAQNNNRTGNAAYTTMLGQDITHLFSNASFVDFYNSPAINPSIVKVETGTAEYSDSDESGEQELLGYTTKLSGAQFRISRLASSRTNEAGEVVDTWEYYTRQCAGNNQPCTFDWKTDLKEAYVFTSDKAGTVWQDVSLMPYREVNGKIVPWTYRLEEMKAPTGYMRLSEPIHFQLYNEENPEPGMGSGAITMISVIDSGNHDDPKGAPVVRVSSDGMTMYVENPPSPQPEPTITLPATGARTWWWLMPAGLLLLAAAMLLANHCSSSRENQ